MRTFLLVTILLGSTLVIGCNAGGASGVSAPGASSATPVLIAPEPTTRPRLPRKFDWSPVATEEATSKPPDLPGLLGLRDGTPSPTGASGATTVPKKPTPTKTPAPSNGKGLIDTIPGVKGSKELLGGVLSLAKFIFVIGLVVFVFTLPWMLFKFFLKIPIWIASLFGKIFSRQEATKK